MRLDNFPGPVEWVTIPGGSVRLDAGGYLPETTTFEISAFVIGKYPVTNQQYALFMAAGGYQQSGWWTQDGWAICQRENWTAPRRWENNDVRYGDCPVIGVSWYEATAFCCWASDATGEAITLPTEKQWQRAAQGDDGREFPWGNDDPDIIYCNWNRDVGRPTPVTRYPDGASPFGVMDMSGNAWELCRTGWETGTESFEGRERRIVRGGCLINDSPITLRTTRRDGPFPVDAYHLFGFRCTRES